MNEGGESASDFGDIDSLVKSDRQAICQRKSVGDEKSALLTIDPQDRKVLPKEGESWNARGALLVLVGKAKATHNLVPDGANPEADDGRTACCASGGASDAPWMSQPGGPLTDLAGGRAS